MRWLGGLAVVLACACGDSRGEPQDMDATAAIDGEVPDASDPTDGAQLDAEPADADADAAIDGGPDATACAEPAPARGVIGTRAAPHEVSAASRS